MPSAHSLNKGRAVRVPSSALATLEEIHGIGVFLHGTIKVPPPTNKTSI